MATTGDKPQCPKCGNKLRFYDGCLGYEALRCDACGFEQDLNWKANGNPNELFHDKLSEEEKRFIGERESDNAAIEAQQEANEEE